MRGRAFAAVFCLIGFATVSQAGVRAIWAVNDGEKIERDDLSNPNKARNSAWDGKTIRLFGARNEVIAFQVIVESDAKPVEAVSITLPKLSGGRSVIQYRPPAADPSNYAGRNIQLFSVNYMLVKEPSRANWIWRPDSPAAPKDPTGWKPVQIVPENALKGRGGFPLRIEPESNQAFWVEIYTPRDLAAGTYRGEVAVQADGRRHRVPVQLELLDFTLPDENSMHAMLYYSGDQPELYQGRNMDAEYHRFAHRNRVELVHAYNESSVKAAIGRFDGKAFLPAEGYSGPGEGTGNRIVPLTFYGPGKQFDEKADAWKRSDAWMSFLAEAVPKALTFLYLPDEPGRRQFEYIRRLGDNIHSNPGPGGKLPTFVTHSYTPELEGAIDYWCSGPRGYRIEMALKERSQGRDYWVYNGGRPAGGAITIDAPATDPRSMIWASFKHGIGLYFYWYATHWRHNSQKQGERNQNVWTDTVTFDNRGQPNKPIRDQGFIHGDGVLIYPGEDKLHPDQDRGIAGPISSVQLANFRRGLQDHQYLTMAKQLGLDEVVRTSVEKIVPRVFSEAGETVSFSESGNDYEEARYKLAQAIAQAKR